MVLEDDYFLTFFQWLLPGRNGIGALGWFAIWVPLVAIIGLAIGTLRSMLLYGFGDGVYAVARSVDTAVKDLAQLSMRRTLAMAKLAIQESIRRWVLIVFAVFILFVLFAGWFLDAKTDDPPRLYMGFVLGVNNMLLLLLALVLSTFSLPTDIRNRTIYTVVTKPVRASEIILGRVIGFAAVGTVFVVAMCLISYVFVTRGLNHEHQVDSTTLVRELDPAGNALLRGTTTRNRHHEHEFTLAFVQVDEKTPGASGTNEVQELAIPRSATGSSFRLAFGDESTSVLTLAPPNQTTGEDAQPSAEDVQRALEGLSAFDPQDITVEGEPGGPWTVEFQGKYAGENVDLIRGLCSGVTEMTMKHRHEVEPLDVSESPKFVIGPPVGWLEARVADYGKLRFLGRTGKQRSRAYNVGKEWAYRSYIEGGTKSAAIWKFDGVTQRRFPDGLPLEMNLRVFRTHKGDVEKGIVGLLKLRNPTSGDESEPQTFTAKEFQIDNMFIGLDSLKVRKRDGTLQSDVNLFEDLVDEDGTLEVIVQCAEPAQYFGMAEGDLFLRQRDASFFWNFVKGHVAIWLQMILVICYGVMFSTVLSGIVAMIATLSTVVLGYTVDFVSELARGEVPGGGALESSFRIVRQMNVSSEIDPNMGTRVVQFVDFAGNNVMWFVSSMVPNYKELSRSIAETGPLVNDFEIYNTLIARQCLTTLGYSLVVIIVSYFLLKSREIAA